MQVPRCLMPVWRAFRGAAGPGGRADLCRDAARSAAPQGWARRPPRLEFIVRSSPGRLRSRTTPPATGTGRTEANRPDQVAVFHHPERTVLTPLRISDSDPEHLTTLASSTHCWHTSPLGTSAVFAMAPWLLRGAWLPRLASRTVAARPRYGAGYLPYWVCVVNETGPVDDDGYLDAAGYRVAQCFGQRRVGAPGRLHSEGRDAAGDNGPIAAE